MAEEESKKKRGNPQVGISTYGIRNSSKGGKFVVICNSCKQTVKSLTNNMCEDCYTTWFTQSGDKRYYVGKK